MLYAKYNTATRILSYANAGHNPALLLRRGELSCTELDAEGLILGVNRVVTFEEKSIQMQGGDLLFLYTDGIIESESPEGQLFGIGRLCTILAEVFEDSPETIIERVLKEVSDYTTSPTLHDDISIVVMKVE